ncbi:MAG: phosphatase family protein [Alphaproteobacteria bacterium]|nr:phosphatase family protein [Alphaproteobacteria bacterium]
MSDRKLSATLLALFLLWFAMLSLGGPDWVLDRNVLNILHGGVLTAPARKLTLLGNWPATTLISLAAAGWLLSRGERRRALLLLGIAFSGRLLVEAQKIVFARARPDAEGHLVAVHSLSFPSAHAASSMLVWLGIAMLAVSPRFRAPAIVVAVALSLLTGLTRLVLDVHWPSDVIGGWAFGAFWTVLLIRLAARATPSPAY